MYINFSILNFFKRKYEWNKTFSYYKRLSKNKFIEVECFYSNYHLIGIEFEFVPFGKDHAGLKFKLNLFGWEIELGIYDNRHWDFKNGKWE
jgi:hypothetical protein